APIGTIPPPASQLQRNSMITYLKDRNLAIVEEFAIEPGPGLNVLTGETGAGKSLLIDSLELLRGARGSTDMIRAGSERMSAEAIFQLPSRAAESLEAAGIESEPSGDGVEVIVKRELSSGGRGRVLVNGSPLSVRELAAAMDAILEIHGQHESQSRVAGQSYRELLDEFGGHAALLGRVRDAYRDWRIAANELRELTDVIEKLRDLARTLGNLSESVRHDPERLEEVEDRLVTIERLNKKYGGSVAAVLEHLVTIQDEYERLSDYEANVEKLARAEELRFAGYRKLAEELSGARAKAARGFQSAIQSELNDLAMERTTVRITLGTAADADSRFTSDDGPIAFGE